MSGVRTPSRTYRDAHDQECTVFTDGMRDECRPERDFADTRGIPQIRCKTLEEAVALKKLHPNRIVIVTSFTKTRPD